MKTSSAKKRVTPVGDEMKPHYDFRNGDKPNYARRFPEGAVITITGSNGAASRQKRIEMKSAVVLDSDVSKVFSDSKSVNAALRHLIAALPKRSRAVST